MEYGGAATNEKLVQIVEDWVKRNQHPILGHILPPVPRILKVKVL